ncbi:MAG: Stp1/IreP family PP2C-type Ser/Thr phosphatase [Acidobacteria bacterium]|nr:Stp1/IreP family PP2C-type Ser/Thr phosphatase [Acidobacteriota bacterium]
MKVDIGARTDVGRVRSNNEDNFKVVPELNLFVLSDGMGGEAHGEVASKMAVEGISAHVGEAEKNPKTPLFSDARPDLTPATNRLISAIHLANQMILQTAEKDPTHKGMGATVVALRLNGERVSLAHVGDSRIYLMRNTEIQQLTEDHSLVAEQVRRGVLTQQQAEESKMQSVLLRALGVEAEVQVDADEQLLLDGDTLLMCSDGLTRMVTDTEIAATLLEYPKVQEAVDKLILMACENGGQDNVTVVAVKISMKSDGLIARIWEWLNEPMDS